MDQAQQVGALFAAFVLSVAVCAVLYFSGSLKARRRWMMIDPKHRLLIVLCFIGFVLWVASAKVVRPWAAAIGLEGHWTLDLAPSLFAGVYLTAIVALIRRLGPLLAFVHGTTLTLLVEGIQLWLPGFVFDPLDVLAGVFGVALVTMLLSRYLHRTCGIYRAHDVRKGSPPMASRTYDSRRGGDGV